MLDSRRFRSDWCLQCGRDMCQSLYSSKGLTKGAIENSVAEIEFRVANRVAAHAPTRSALEMAEQRVRLLKS